MAEKLYQFITGLIFKESASEKDILALNKIIENLPEASLKRFYEQFLSLCSQFNEFYIFMETGREREWETKVDKCYQAALSAATHIQKTTEAGFADLKAIILNLQNYCKTNQVQEIVDGLINTYHRNIESPVIGKIDIDEKLNYPQIGQAFIPQAYQLLRYSGKELLALPDTWANLRPQQNMLSFWARYCLDIGSVENLLLILGEPGVGKSLLTKILCARMISSTSILLRIPLREHSMEEEIEHIVCKQLSKDGDASEPVKTFKWFAKEFPQSPIILLFDGYDEVLQATGEVYRNLLNKIQHFQDECLKNCRPIKVVVTSRETLIDKAYIPKGTIVMRLLEFDEARTQQWITIWNEKNHFVLSDEGLDDFSIPKGNSDIMELSKQPLLLQMLAIYDADFETKTNALARWKNLDEHLDRTGLFDELLRRFVRRELKRRQKGRECIFEELDKATQNFMVDTEIKRLGIAALGMFVREKLSLHTRELKNDLECMGVKSTDYNHHYQIPLENVDNFFVSFFFIHSSRLGSTKKVEETAFEFLHKTFYEFLVADLILQYLMEVVDSLYDKGNSSQYEATLYNPDICSKAYYAALNGACLCMEPEIIKMICEWKDSKRKRCFQGEISDFNRVMDSLFNGHTEMIYNGEFKPSSWESGGLADGHSFSQSCAVYLMNLLTLQILTRGQCRIKIEKWRCVSRFVHLNAPLPQKRSPKLETLSTQHLRISPSDEIILKFMSLFQLQREGDDILLKKRNLIHELGHKNLLEVRQDILHFIQDDEASSFYRLHDVEYQPDGKLQLKRDLCLQGFDLQFETVIAEIHQVVLANRYIDLPEFSKLLNTGSNLLLQHRIESVLVFEWLLGIRLLVTRTPPLQVFTRERDDCLQPMHTLAHIVFLNYDDGIILILLEIIQMLGLLEILSTERDDLYRIMCRKKSSPNLVETIGQAILKSFQGFDPKNSIAHNPKEYNTAFEIKQKILFGASPKEIAFLSKYLYRINDDILLNLGLKEIEKNWEKYLKESPEDLPTLLQMYLDIGQFNTVKEFFQNLGKENLTYLLNKTPPITVSKLLLIAEIVGEDTHFSEYILMSTHNYALDAGPYPGAIMRKLQWMSSSNGQRYEPSLTSVFLDHYAAMFRYNMVEAVCLLFRIASDASPVLCQERLLDAYRYSLRRFDLLLSRSVKATAYLLILFENLDKSARNKLLDGEFHREMDFYVKKCFNKTLIDRNPENVPLLTELLESMTEGTKSKMKDYFAKQKCFLQLYSLKLTEKIAVIYQQS